MAQRYSDPTSLARMKFGACPECGGTPELHLDEKRFWHRPAGCDLTREGVVDRIAQYRSDEEYQEGIDNA